MQTFVEADRVYVKNKLRILYKKPKCNTLYIKYKNEYVPYKTYTKMVGGNPNYNNYYIDKNKYINIREYKQFLNNIRRHINIGIRYNQYKVITNENMCACNNDVLTSIYKHAEGTYTIYRAKIKNPCVTNFMYLKPTVNQVALKVCDEEDDIEECAFFAGELLASINFAHLVVNNITSNLLLFLGCIRKCSLSLENAKYKTVLFSNLINGKTFQNLLKDKIKLTHRQIFELFYTIICCYASYGYCIDDINFGNFMVFNDDFDTQITVLGNTFYFPNMKASICIIDYQVNDNPDNIVPIKKYINNFRQFIDDAIFKELSVMTDAPFHILIKQLISCPVFQQYKVPRANHSIPFCRNIVFNVLPKPL